MHLCSRRGCRGPALGMGTQDLLVCDVGDDAAAALQVLEKMREKRGSPPVARRLDCRPQVGGIGKKAEAMRQPTRCLFKPIDPNSLIAVVDQLLWMPTLVSAHRRKGSTPKRPGWVTL